MIIKQFLTALILSIVCMTICLLTGAQPVSAAPAAPGAIQITQPDGYVINAHIMGDQYQNQIEAENGCAIIENQKTGYWEFAVQDSIGNMIPSGMVYQPYLIYPGTLQSQLMANANQSAIVNSLKSPSLIPSAGWGNAPATGDKKVLVIMVAFANRTSLTTPADWNSTFFNTTSGAKSLANYFKDNSISKVSISPVTHTQAGNPDGVISVTLTADHPNTRGTLNLATETIWANAALEAASDYIEFSALDTNLNGTLDTDEASIYFIVAGYETSSTTEIPSIWSHSTIDFTGSPELSIDGLDIRRWSATGERADTAQRTRMGIVTHEAAHLLFNLPDLFDTVTKTPGLGIFSLMGTGCWGCALDDFVQGATPVNLDAWSRQYLGWATPRIPLVTGSMTFGAPLASENAPVKLGDPRIGTKEYFLVENRPPTGWDAGMARSFLDNWSGGLLVLHIDEEIGTPTLNNINHYTAGGHQGVQVDEASTVNGSLYLTGASFSDGNKRHLFYSGNNANFTPATTPSSRLYDGTSIGVGLSSISAASSSMTANVTPAAVSTPTFTPDGGTYDMAQYVAISCENTPGATIYYTTDGGTPSSTNGTLYTTAVKIRDTVTLKAIGYYPGVATSDVKSAFYDINPNRPTNTSLTPNTGTIILDHKTSLASLYTDPAGYSDIKNCSLMINTGATTTGAGYFFYDAVNNLLYLRSTADDAFIGGYEPGSANVIYNGNIILYCADTTVDKIGNDMTVNWSIALGSFFAGNTCTAFMQVISISDIGDPMEQMGVFNTSIHKLDLLIKTGAESSYSGTGIFSTDGNNQTKSQNAIPGQKKTYLLKAKNVGNSSETFTISGTAGGSGWTVKYYELPSNADITSEVTGSGWTTGTLAPGAYKGLYANVTPSAAVPAGSVNTLLVSATSAGDTTKIDVVKAVTTFVPTYKSDLLIKTGLETTYSGTGVFSTDGDNQTKSQNAMPGQRRVYAFSVKNTGNANDSFMITASAGPSGWTVRYYERITNVDITSQVTGSGFTTPTLAPGACKDIYVFVTPDATVTEGSTMSLLVSAISSSDSTKQDVVKASTTVIPAYKPDLLIKTGSEASYSGTGVFSADGDNQTKSQNAFTGQRRTFLFRAKNAGNAYDSLRVTGTGGGSGWTVKYYDIATGLEITSQVTGSGWTTGTLAPGIYKGIYVYVTADATVESGAVNTLLISAASVSDGTKIDVVKAVTIKELIQALSSPSINESIKPII